MDFFRGLFRHAVTPDYSDRFGLGPASFREMDMIGMAHQSYERLRAAGVTVDGIAARALGLPIGYVVQTSDGGWDRAREPDPKMPRGSVEAETGELTPGPWIADVRDDGCAYLEGPPMSYAECYFENPADAVFIAAARNRVPLFRGPAGWDRAFPKPLRVEANDIASFIMEGNTAVACLCCEDHHTRALAFVAGVQPGGA